MFKKGMKLSATALLLSSTITAVYADGAYKDVAPKPRLPMTSVFLGYTFMHHYYNSTWQNSYRTVTGSSPSNNYSGIDFGLDQMLTDWLALHVKYAHYFRKGSSASDGRQSGITLGGLGFYNVTPSTWLLGMIGATVGAFSHKGDNTVLGTNPSFTDADVSFAIGAGLQYQLSDCFYIRPMINALPFQDRSDTNASLGFSIDLVYALN